MQRKDGEGGSGTDVHAEWGPMVWPTGHTTSGGGSAALSCKAEAGEAHDGARWQRERERGGTRGAWVGPKE
jgi:hypothetical protein